MASNNNNDDIPPSEMIKTLKNLSKVEIDVLPPSGVLLYGIDGAEIRSEYSKLIPNKNTIHRVYLRYGNYKIGWIIDQDVKKCLLCNKAFSLFLRRHHCRNCGYVVCDSCSSHRAIIRQLKEEATSVFSRPDSRVCNVCASKHRLNEIWDARPPTPAAPPPEVPPAPPVEEIKQPSPSSSSQMAIETPQNQQTNPAQYQMSDPVPLNLFPIIDEEMSSPQQEIEVPASTPVEENEARVSLREEAIPPPTLQTFSVDDNDAEEDDSDDQKDNQALEISDPLPPVAAQRPTRRASWLEQKLGINLHPFGSDEAENKDDGEVEGEGGIDSDSDVDNASSASGESLNSSRLSSRISRTSKSRQSRSIRMTRTSDTYDEDSNLSTSPMYSPASTNMISPPQSPQTDETHQPITMSQLKLHSEQQRLIQLDKERREEKLRLKAEQERLQREQEDQSTPIKSTSGYSDNGLSPPVSSASSSPAGETVSSSSPSPMKRRSSLMWFFGVRDSKESGKPSPIMRRGSDPGRVSRNSEDSRNSQS